MEESGYSEKTLEQNKTGTEQSKYTICSSMFSVKGLKWLCYSSFATCKTQATFFFNLILLPVLNSS